MEDTHRGKKRKKKSFLKNARKYGKKGKFGRGSYLNEDTYQYFVRVLELLGTNDFETEEEKVIFTSNVFDETVNEEVNYSCNQLASAALEKLLPTASDTVLKRFMTTFEQDLHSICLDPYGSYVLQTLLLTASERGMITGSPSEENTIFCEWVLKVSNFVLNNLQDFIWDTHANHIIRSVTECLGGVLSGTTAGNKTQQHTQIHSKMKTNAPLLKARKVPSSYVNLLQKFVEHLSNWPNFEDLGFNNLTSGLLQTLLFATKEADQKLTKKLVSKLLKECFMFKTKANSDMESIKQNYETETATNPDILPVFEDAAATYLLEAAITVASPKSLKQIYAKCFLNHLATLAQHPQANFSVQRLLDCCTEKDEFEKMFSELEGHFEDILASCNTGVILSLAQACKIHTTKQGCFQQMLMKALHCMEPNERQSLISPLTISLITHEEQVNSNKLYIPLHGSLILQTLLNFNKPIKTVNSLLCMNTGDLKTVFTDPRGCHIMDAFMKSEFVGEKSRDKMIKKLQGMYVALACSKHGSRSVDAIWEMSNIKQKLIIMDELSVKEPILNSDEYGSILSSKYCLSLYKHRKDEWKDLQGKEFRKRKLFSDIIGNAGQSN